MEYYQITKKGILCKKKKERKAAREEVKKQWN